MAFWSKSRKDDIEDVKRAVSEEQKQEITELPKIDLGKMPERPAFAPLFVKIDRYQNVLSTIDNLKTVLLGVRDLLNLMQQIDKIKLESEIFLQKNIQEIVKNIAEMDKEFVRPKGISVGEKTGKPFHTDKVESYISELQRELEHLRSQLHSIE